MSRQSTPPALPLVPSSFFGIVLGLAGLGSDWRAAHAAWGLPAAIGEWIYAAAGGVWTVVTVLFALKWVVAVSTAREEAEHAVQCCFIGLAGVATMLVAQGALPHSRALAIALFVLGAGFTLLFALWRTGVLWRGGRDAAGNTPVLYLPTVAGSLVTGIVAAALGWKELAELAFGAGVFSWLAIESVLLHRLYTAAALAPALRPTLGIQLAPPAVAAGCYVALGGSADLFAHMLIGYAVLQALLLTRLIGWIREQPFSASYWAFTFGATALAGAATRLAIQTPDGLFAGLAPVLFALANLLVIAIAVGTVRLLLQGRLLPPGIPAPPAAATAAPGTAATAPAAPAAPADDGPGTQVPGH